MGINKKTMLLDIFHESRTNLILGGKGAGKTNFSTVLMNELVGLGYDIYTNIHFFSPVEVPIAIKRGKLPRGINYQRVPLEIHVISSLSELLYGLLKPGRKAVFIDEAGIVSPSGVSKDTKNVKQLAYIIRHFDCAFTLITQVAGSVPPDLRENLVDYRLSLYGNKRSRRKLDIGARSIISDVDGNDIIDFPSVAKWGGIPMSEYPYDGDFPSSFKIDIDLKLALDAFGECSSSIEVEEKGKSIIDGLTKSKNKSTKREMILKYKEENPGASPLHIAKKFSTTRVYVSQVLTG